MKWVETEEGGGFDIYANMATQQLSAAVVVVLHTLPTKKSS